MEKIEYFYTQYIVVCDFHTLDIVRFKMPQDRLFLIFGISYRLLCLVARIGFKRV